MKITILAIGSRGDVQPYLALGLGLQRAGHAIRFCAGNDFEEFVTGHGLDFYPLGVRSDAFVRDYMQGALQSGNNTVKALIDIVRHGMQFADAMQQGMLAACDGSEAMIASLVGLIGGYNIAEKMGVPLLMALTMPVPGRTRTMPNALFPTIPLARGESFNALTHRMIEGFMWQMLSFPANKWRRELGLKPLSHRRWPYDTLGGKPLPALHAVSPQVIPRPFDWGEHIHLTGYWFLDHAADWQPPADLVDFIAAGSPPVYVGFGSMDNPQNAEALTHMVLAALQKSGQRGIIATGWGGLKSQPHNDDVFVLERCPHDWLFPRMAAVVHHGGAGTTAAGLRAGVPSVIVPFFGDQPFWGHRVAELGVGASIPRKKLTADKLAYAIRVATSHEPMRQRAAELGAKIRAEDGVGEAVRIVEQHLEQYR